MKSIIALTAALALSTISYAADEAPAAPAAPVAGADAGKPKHSPEDTFKKLDTNNDGFLSLDEYKASPRGKKDPAAAEEAYKKMDTKGDGKVTLEEFKAAHAAHGKKNKQ